MTKYFSDTLNVLSGIKEVNALPFSWGMSNPCLPEDIYEELSAKRPMFDIEDNAESNKRFDIRGYEALTRDGMPAIWCDFIKYHTSRDFYHQILDRFEGHFTEYYPTLKNMRDYKTGVRFSDDEADIYLDCQISINTPVNVKSTVAPPHVDNPLSLWASLLYMKDNDDDAGGDLVLHQCIKSASFHGKRHAELDCIRPWKTIPYDKNTYVCFINSRQSVHSVTEREVTDKQRLMVNITLEFKNNKIFQI